MLSEKQVKEIREHLEKAQNPLFFFDNDQDGLCSFLLLQRYIGRGKGIAIDGRAKALKIVPYIAKTNLGDIDAVPGGAEEGPIIFRKYALNAGKIRPRKFEELVYEEWEDKFGESLQVALDTAAVKTGYAF